MGEDIRKVVEEIRVSLAKVDREREFFAFSGRVYKFIFEKAECSLLEMEDILFHENSAVIMPDNLDGKRSSSDGNSNVDQKLVSAIRALSAVIMPDNLDEKRSSSDGSSNVDQKRVSGIRALSLVFRQLEMYPSSRILICGHADRSGGTEYNFELSRLRAAGVYYLLSGQRSEWVRVAASKHTIEDYKQIMKYYATMNRWLCDPGEVNNVWDKKTREATEEFIFSWNSLFHYKFYEAKPIYPDVVGLIDKSDKHEWPPVLWEAVYDLYEHDLVKSTTGADRPDSRFNELRNLLGRSFISSDKPFVACGESFPRDSYPGINYRSQTEHRVEIFFFEKDNTPKLDCPDRTTTVHKAHECPLRRGECFKFKYIDTSSFFTATYHLKFEYYDRIKEQSISVPVALPISVWKDGNKRMQSKVVLEDNGIMTINVSGITHYPRETNIHFTIETPEQYYLYTESKSSAPVLVTESQLQEQLAKERNALPPDQQSQAPLTFAQMPLARRRHYYDLPKKWDSRNWFCSKGLDVGIWKEMSVQLTTKEEPICFSLDDVVLVTKKGDDLVPIAWDADFRFSVFSVKMELNNPDFQQPYFTFGTSSCNLLSHYLTGDDLRVIALKGKFYDITSCRTNKGDIIGARAAVLDQSNVHVWEHRREPVAEICGNYDLHYFSECLDSDGNECSVLLIYWVAHLKKGVGNVSDDDLDNFRREGFKGSKERWEKKGYWFEPEQDPENRRIKVLPRFFFEENRQIAQPYCIVKIVDPADPEFRSNMGLDIANFKKDTFREVASGHVAREDNTIFRRFTMAHELGHAIGLDDEYAESIKEDSEWDPELPEFEHSYNGMPYSADLNSMMVIDCSPRLRHLWIQCRWLNENEKVRKLTGNTVFCVRHRGYQGGEKYEFKYYLPLERANFYNALYEQENVRNGANGKFDLFLYCLGQDEMTKKEYVELVKDQSDFDGILVVCVNIVWYFKNHTGNGNDQWLTNESKIERIRSFQRSIRKSINKHFWMKKVSPDKNFSKIYLYFLPHHQFEGVVGPKAHFSITVRTNNPQSGDKPTENYSGFNLTVGENTNNIAILRYMLGLDYKNADGKLITTLAARELDFIKRWVENKTGSRYELHTLGR